jgi:predicted small lipoprotein YifL
MKILQASLMVVLLAGCGYRGPLYLPGEEPVKKRRTPLPAGQTDPRPESAPAATPQPPAPPLAPEVR